MFEKLARKAEAEFALSKRFSPKSSKRKTPSLQETLFKYPQVKLTFYNKMKTCSLQLLLNVKWLPSRLHSVQNSNSKIVCEYKIAKNWLWSLWLYVNHKCIYILVENKPSVRGGALTFNGLVSEAEDIKKTGRSQHAILQL